MKVRIGRYRNDKRKDASKDAHIPKSKGLFKHFNMERKCRSHQMKFESK